ncbi:hypothetical protein MIMGU_mgv1a002247mg [Erythranthe guttata]|uniref:FRIGIDA-like protein n=1 Tax=Erythranthe guttata TaxID=4155 RepID=A0A022S535_ERYGU|nr:hypothetical protein MIMGU_mgv1a002247mg [Erythranthe guttata]
MEHLLHDLKPSQAGKNSASNGILNVVNEWKGMGDNLFNSLVGRVSEIESREKNLVLVRESLDKRLKEVEEREREFEFFRVRKKRELALKERGLTPALEDFAKEARLREEKLDEDLKSVRDHIDSLEAARAEVEGFRMLQMEKLKEIENRERQIDSMGCSVEKRLRDVKQKEDEFDAYQDAKWRQLAAKEEILTSKRDEFAKEVELAKFEEMVNKFNAFQQDKLQKLEVKERELSVMRMELLEEVKLRDEKLAERLEEIESREIAAHKSLSDGLHEADLIRESLEKGFKEFEIMEKDFNAFREDKLQSLEAQEQQLRVMRIELLDEVQFREEKMAERLKEIDSWESVTHNSLNARLSEADLIQESLEKRFKKFEEMEEEFNSFQQDKMRKLELEEQRLSVTRIELLKEVELRDQKATEQQKLAQDLLKCLEKTMELEKWAKEFKSSQQKKMRELEVAGDKLRLIDEELSLEGNVREEKFDKQEIGAKKIECNSVKDCVQKEVDVHEPKAKELKEPEKRIKLEEDVEKGVTVERVDPRCEVQDRIIVELFMHSIEKDLEFLSDEVFKVLLHSSDPAKLILEAVVLFCAPPYVKDGDIKIEIQERGILLLDQLTKMSPNIPRCIREAAILVANAWKSKMRTSAENPLNVLGFLHFLAAYKISSCFNKVEILGFLKSVAEHKQTPGLFRVLGLTENIPGN